MTYFIAGVCTGVILAITLLVIVPAKQTLFYKQGQIDALNGKVLFVLVKQPDGTTIWMRRA